MTTLMMILGIVVFVIGLLVSIAWHELGHLSTAKLFGIRVPQYMVGFGPTIWSRKKGETEYGIKAIPFGGYIRMIGMFPPGPDGRIEARSTSLARDDRGRARPVLRGTAPGRREAPLLHTQAVETRHRDVRGPVHEPHPRGGAVPDRPDGLRRLPADHQRQLGLQVRHRPERGPRRLPQDRRGLPAAAAGLQAGDKILSFGGVQVDSWNKLSDEIRANPGKDVAIVVERKGEQVTLNAKIATNQVAKKDSSGQIVQGQYVTAGFLGFSAATGIVRQDFGDSLTWMGDRMGEAVDSIAALPGKIPALWNAAFDGGERAADSPMGVVGAARVGGEIFTLDIPPTQQLAMALMLVAGFNLSLFLFNMLLLLPLDGGHVAGALWEALRRNTAKVLKRPDPGPFDVAKLMPVAYVVAGIFICFTLLVLVADVVNPVRIS